VISPITTANVMLCRKVKRNNLASSPGFMPVAAAIRIGSIPSLLAVTACRFPKMALAEVSQGRAWGDLGNPANWRERFYFWLRMRRLM
jgi:hypothetical protein